MIEDSFIVLFTFSSAFFVLKFLELTAAIWVDAQQYCSSLGSRLMEVRTQEDYDRAQQIRSEKGGNIWLGGSDIADEGVWIWNSNGEGINMDQFWMINQPDNFTVSEDCIEITGVGFNDSRCAKIVSFVCETN